MKRAMAFAMTAAVTLGGCARSIPYPLGIRDTSNAVETGALNPPETGPEYCRRLAGTADRAGIKMLTAGILLGIVAGGLAVAGAAAGPDTNADAGWHEKNRNTLMVASGGLLSIPTTILLMRSKDASNASGTASEGIGKEDGAAMETCLKARAEWASTRGKAADAASNAFDERLKKIDEAANTAKAEKDVEEKVATDPAADPTAKAAATRRIGELDTYIRGLEDAKLRMLSPPVGRVPPAPGAFAPPQPSTPPTPVPLMPGRTPTTPP